MAFAEPIKRIVGSLLQSTGIGAAEVDARLYGTRKEDPVAAFNNLSARDVMQLVGTEFGRDMINPDLWVLIMRETIRRTLAFGMPVVIDDLRFPNEYDMLQGEGATLVKITSPRMIKASEHRSDGALEGPGYGWHDNVTNDGTLEQLRETAKYLAGASK